MQRHSRLSEVILRLLQMIRRYSELRRYSDIFDRFNYLKLDGQVGTSTFGFDRFLNQTFYRSHEWQEARRIVILRDNGNDLGVEGYTIGRGLIVHHMNPITQEDILERRDDIFDPEFLICVSDRTHNAIHFGDASLLPKDPVVRSPNDTCPWK